jgi:hypothetical protein
MHALTRLDFDQHDLILFSTGIDAREKLEAMANGRLSEVESSLSPCVQPIARSNPLHLAIVDSRNEEASLRICEASDEIGKGSRLSPRADPLKPLVLWSANQEIDGVRFRQRLKLRNIRLAGLHPGEAYQMH